MKILGHSAIMERLSQAADRNGLHHAYLFEGPSGLGRRRVADWLAQYVNCTGKNPPCGACPQCIRIQAGTHPDVIVLEPDPSRASRTISVDAVREVCRRASYHRFDSKRRFILIDPADSMLEPAANALLKTLEEPPDGTGFILLATSARRLLPTIVSRCQRVRFGAVPTDEIAAWLQERGVDEALLVARLAMGSPGRALSLADGALEQRRGIRDRLVAFGNGTVKDVFDTNEASVKGGRQTWLPKVRLQFEVLEELLRDVVVLATGSPLPLLHSDAPDLIENWAHRLYPGGVERVQAALAQADEHFEVNVHGRLVLDSVFTVLRAELG